MFIKLPWISLRTGIEPWIGTNLFTGKISKAGKISLEVNYQKAKNICKIKHWTAVYNNRIFILIQINPQKLNLLLVKKYKNR